MKKFFNRCTMLFMAMALCVGFAACSDDDEEEEPIDITESATIIGTWKAVDEESTIQILCLGENGVIKSSDNKNPDNVDSQWDESYEYNEKKAVIYWNIGGEIETLKIISLTKTKLVVNWTDYTGETERIEFKRISDSGEWNSGNDDDDDEDDGNSLVNQWFWEQKNDQEREYILVIFETDGTCEYNYETCWRN